LEKNEQKESICGRLMNFVSSPWNVVFLVMVFLGLATLVWVTGIIWTDLTFYGKELVTILLGSRIGENISLGIDFRLVYYLLIGFNLLAWSLPLRYVKR